MPNLKLRDKGHIMHESNQSNGTLKQQSAFEFITTYGWAILILAVVIAILYYFIGIPSTTVPNTCQFLFGSNCQGIVATSSASSTKMTMVITNAQNYPILNPLIKVATDSYGNLSAACVPVNQLVNPGSEIICNVTIPQKISPGTTITGTIYLSVYSCPSGNMDNCQPKQLQTYKGNIITRVTLQSSDIHLTSTSTSITSSTSTSTSTTSSTSTSTSSTSSTSTTTSTSSTSTISLCPPNSQSWTTNGIYSFSTPSGCGTGTVYTINVIGGGGGGAGAPDSSANGGANCASTSIFGPGGGGGGGGAFASGSTSSIPSGTPFTIYVGEGGFVNTTSRFCGDAQRGGFSEVTSSYFTVNAEGGQGGYGSDQTGGTGGTYSCSGISCSGSDGVAGSDGTWTNSPCCVSYGGNGGSSGSPGNGGTGGITNTAGGSPSNVVPINGATYGGGGGGGTATVTSGGYNANNNQADGAVGEVIISWN